MTETKLRTVVGMFFLVAHIAVMLMLLALFLKRPPVLTRQEFTTSMAIIVPAVSGLSALALTYVVSVRSRKQYRARSETLSGVYVFTTLLFPIGFVLVIAGLIVVRAFDGFSSFEDFKLALGASETIFAGYSGKVMASLFAKESQG